MAHQLSVLILTRNRLSKLQRCLKLLERQSVQGGGPPDEVVIVDTGSSDGTREWLAEYAGRAPFAVSVSHFEEGSFAEARNHGLDLTAGELIAFLDDDCEPEKEWTARIHAGLECADALGGIAIPGEPLVFPLWWHGELNWLIGLAHPEQYRPNTGAVHYPSTSNMAVRREVFDKVRFKELPADFRKGYVYEGCREDAQLWRDIRRAGFRTACDPKCRVLHCFGHERFNKRSIMRRAWIDGKVFWLREQQKAYLDTAVRDIVSSDVRWIEAMLRVDHQGLYAEMAASYLWSLRQLGFVWSYMRTRPKLTHTFKVIGAYARLTSRLLIDLSKRLVRKSTIASRRRQGLIRSAKRGPDNLLVACFGFLGDMVIIEPACRAFKAANPNCRMNLLTHSMGEALHRSTGIWDNILPAEDFPATNSVLRAIEDQTYDDIIIPYYHRHDTALLNRLTRSAPCITFDSDVGFTRRLYYEWCGERVQKDFSRNEIQNILSLFRTVGNARPPEAYRWTFSEDELNETREQFDRWNIQAGQALLVHFGAQIDNKRWPTDRWVDLCRRLTAELNRPVVLVGGNAHREESEAIAREAGERTINICGQTTPRQLGSMISLSQLLVTTDSGPKHLAFACGTSTITLYGPSDPKRWGAMWDSDKHRQLTGGMFDLTPEELHGLPEDYLMRNISIDAVLDQIHRTLSLPGEGK